MRARGPAAVALLCLVPVLLCATSGSMQPRWLDASTSLASVAVVLALAGTSAFAINLVIGARLKLVDRLFGGLDKSFMFHRLNGRIAFILLVAHAVLVLASRAVQSPAAALALLSPAAGWNVFAGPVALVAMAIAIGLTLYARLGHELFVYVQRAFGFVFIVAGFHFFGMPGGRAQPRALSAYMVVLFVAGLCAWAYRSLFGNLLVRRRDYRVTGVDRLGGNVVEITMTPKDKHLRFTPGQFLFVTFYSSGFSAQFHPSRSAPRTSSRSSRSGPGTSRTSSIPSRSPRLPASATSGSRSRPWATSPRPCRGWTGERTPASRAPTGVSRTSMPRAHGRCGSPEG
jgi:predicted ferric reductase